MDRVLLVRHAVTAQTGRRLSGWTPGLHLTDEGRAQARRLAGRLASVPVQAIYSSPLDRCLETAQILAEGRGMAVRELPELGEVRYGDWTGRELKELAREDLWRTVQLHPSGARFPGGESLLEMQTRAVAGIERLRTLAEHAGQTVLVASHADVIKAVAAHYAGLHLDQFQRLVVGPASLTAIGFGPVPRLVRLNDSLDNADLVPPPATTASTDGTGARAARVPGDGRGNEEVRSAHP
jgi:probable phosphomutase (TIGR03848 family)